MMFMAATKQEVASYWHTLSPIIEKAMQEMKVRCFTADDYAMPLLNGTMQLWTVIENEKIIGCVLTSLDQGRAMKICMIHVLAGEKMNEWVETADRTITKFANDNDCGAIQYAGRKGFSKIFPDLVEDGIIYVRKLK